MKDLILLIFVFGCLGLTLRYPFAGILTWAWFTIMTPHQMAFGTFGIPLNLVIAAVTLFAIVYTREAQRFRLDGISVLLLLFLIWQAVAQQFSVVPENSEIYFSRFMKTMVFVLLCAQMATDKLRFHALLWVLAAGVGFFAVKGAIFTVMTLGEFRVQGMPNTVLEDNNHFGIAAATVLPLLIYLRGQLNNPLARTIMVGAIVLSVFGIIGTHSRGALVSLIAFGGMLWWQSRHKIGLALAGTICLVPAVFFMPKKWLDRMGTIAEAGKDASFQGRLDAWTINFQLAMDHPLTGVGLRNSYIEEVAAISAPEKAEAAKAAHSIYFEVLGGSGFIGLTIFLSLFAFSWLRAGQIKRRAFSQNQESARSVQQFAQAPRQQNKTSQALPAWQGEFAQAARISLVIFAVGGASTSMEMWDGYLVVISLIAAVSRQGMVQLEKPMGYARRANKPMGRSRLQPVRS